MVGNKDVSNCRPLWILANNITWGPKPFKVFNRWFEKPEFKTFVEKVWSSSTTHGKCVVIMKEKFKMVKENLKRWNI